MPHISEGLLHAHLDGALGPDEQIDWAKAEAHLAACDDCRRRLDEAAELRDTASGLLSDAAPSPSGARPAFEELVARAEARRADRPSAAGGSWWRTPTRLAWAASLVIAVGAGWIGRQLVVEQGPGGPRVSAEQDATVGRSGAGEGVASDDARAGATEDEALARQDADAAAPPVPEAASRFRTGEQPREPGVVRPEAEALQEKAEARTNVEARTDEVRMQGIRGLAPGTVTPGVARCYAVSPEAHDGGEAAHEGGEASTAGPLETLRLAADGTASLRLAGRPMVGFWEQPAADSLRLRVTDGGTWRELVLIEAEGGGHGDAELAAVACP
jgi:hypothetical protein